MMRTMQDMAKEMVQKYMAPHPQFGKPAWTAQVAARHAKASNPTFARFIDEVAAKL